jgi:antirestriction protein
MEITYLVINVATLIIVAIFAPMMYAQIKGAKTYTEMLDMDKIKAYMQMLDEKSDVERELLIKKHSRINIENLKKVTEFKEKIHHDYQRLLLEVIELLKEIEEEDKAAFIDRHFKSHADFLKFAVLGIEPKKMPLI